ncbi:hypothetical protein MCP1_100018 [Candidatus Terasakiella magnetica]|nr:hypothetical protein MCP1_100018 [Candidatus Terasakiella magnetica]
MPDTCRSSSWLAPSLRILPGSAPGWHKIAARLGNIHIISKVRVGSGRAGRSLRRIRLLYPLATAIQIEGSQRPTRTNMGDNLAPLPSHHRLPATTEFTIRSHLNNPHQ